MGSTQQLICRSAAIVAGLFLGFAPSSSVAEAAGDQGLQGGWAVNETGFVSFPHSTYEQLQLMKDAGAGWVRVNFRLGACFKNWTTTRSGENCRPDRKAALEVYNEVVTAAEGKGLKVQALVSNEAWHGVQDQWNANNAENASGNGYNSYIGSYVNSAVKPLANRFKGRIVEWEIWNEPNSWWSSSGTVYSGGSFIYPSNYAQLLQRSRNTLRGVSSSNKVIFGGLLAHDSGAVAATIVDEEGRVRRVNKRGDVPTDPPRQPGRRPDQDSGEATTATITPASLPCPDPIGTSGAQYLHDTYVMGRQKAKWQAGNYPLDFVGQHPYIDVGGTTSACKIRNYVQDLRNALFEFEGSGTSKKIQVTEVGWETLEDPSKYTPSERDASRQRQATNLTTAFTEFASASGSRGNVARAYWFNVQDVAEAGLFFGLQTSWDDATDFAGVHKASFEAYKTAAAY